MGAEGNEQFDEPLTGGLSRREFLKQGSVLASAAYVSGALPQALAARDHWEPVSDRKIRIGVVGGGFGTAFHWHEHPSCIVHAVSDLIPERRDRLMKTYGCERSYESLEKLVLDEDIDAVAVFTGAPDHARHTILCMEHGKHVICACPACLTLEEAARLKEAKERTGLYYMNAETSYYRWPTITARRLMRAGDLGELVYTEAEYYHPGIGATAHGLSWRDGKRTWRYGFPPMLYPTHSTAFYVGAAKKRLVKVACIGTRDPGEPAFEENVYDNPFCNGMALFLTETGHPFRCNVAWKIFAHGERAQWLGTQGALYMPGWGGQPYTLQMGGETVREEPDYWNEVPSRMRRDSGHGKSHPFLTNEFVTALLEEREPAVDLYEALAFCVPGIVAHRSALEGGASLSIPSFDR
jgi:predicted dehydrogenase